MCSNPPPRPEEQEDRPKSIQDSEADYPIIGLSLRASICAGPVRRKQTPTTARISLQCIRNVKEHPNQTTNPSRAPIPKRVPTSAIQPGPSQPRLRFRVAVVRPWSGDLVIHSGGCKHFFDPRLRCPGVNPISAREHGNPRVKEQMGIWGASFKPRSPIAPGPRRFRPPAQPFGGAEDEDGQPVLALQGLVSRKLWRSTRPRLGPRRDGRCR